MGRPKGSKNKRTLEREKTARTLVRNGFRMDSLEFLEAALGWCGVQIAHEREKNRPSQKRILALYREGVEIAVKLAPFQHARLTMTKVIGDPTRPVAVDVNDNIETLRAKVMAGVVALGLVPEGVVKPEGLVLPPPGSTNGSAN